MKTKHLLINVVLLVALLLAGCSSDDVRVGELRTESKSVELGDAKSVSGKIKIGAGDLKINGGAKKLLEAGFTYNVAKLKPEVEFTDGMLVVQHPDVRGYRTLQDIKDFRNEWDLRFNNDVPMNLSLDMGAGTSDLQLAGLSLTGLKITLGAGKSTVNLSGDWTRDLDVTIQTGAANITVRLPRDVGVRVEIESGPTVVNAPGLTKDGNVYTNEAYGQSDVTLQIKMQPGIGMITLEEDQTQADSGSASLIPSTSGDEKVKFTVDSKEIDGILTHPDTPAPYPAIVLLHGSDRSSAQHPYYTELANNLVRSGFAVLRYNGPGWGGGDSNEAGFETLEYRTQEAISAVKYLQSRPDIESNGVGLWGISQGGWICQMAAATYDGVAFIIPVSGSGVTPGESEVFRVEAMSRAAGFDDDEVAKVVLMRRLMVDILLDEPMYQQINQAESDRLGDGPWREMTELAYAPQPKDLAVEFEKVVKILKSIKDEHWAKFLYLDPILSLFANVQPQAWGAIKDQLRAVTFVYPAEYLVRIKVPVLAIFGENDTYIPVEKSIPIYQQYLGEAGNQAFTYKVFANADHGIRSGAKFADGYFDLMVDWLRNLPIGKSE